MEGPFQQHHTYTQTGLTKPVFLGDKTASARVYLDVPEGVSLRLFLSYDPVHSLKKRRADTQWMMHSAGWLSADFADTLYGPPTAVRLEINSSEGALSAPVTLNIMYEKEG